MDVGRGGYSLNSDGGNRICTGLLRGYLAGNAADLYVYLRLSWLCGRAPQSVQAAEQIWINLLNSAEKEFAAGAQRLTAFQIIIGGVVAAGFFVAGGEAGAKSAMYGAMISVVLAMLLSWGVKRASGSAEADRKKSMVILYVGAAQRFLLRVGIVWLWLVCAEAGAHRTDRRILFWHNRFTC